MEIKPFTTVEVEVDLVNYCFGLNNNKLLEIIFYAFRLLTIVDPSTRNLIHFYWFDYRLLINPFVTIVFGCFYSVICTLCKLLCANLYQCKYDFLLKFWVEYHFCYAIICQCCYTLLTWLKLLHYIITVYFYYRFLRYVYCYLQSWAPFR